ncbi:hypothetical protein HaLaN_29050 [Haematococcus lacustris]|uniref:Uncharacterized protein n=1 Tax=Haematococcus lacustris TaxID=44745 RepID=A0A6A0AEE0_HAELA|nr:hypothetical protein HaLaN_29050 [Haematococcus lacustris]
MCHVQLQQSHSRCATDPLQPVHGCGGAVYPGTVMSSAWRRPWTRSSGQGLPTPLKRGCVRFTRFISRTVCGLINEAHQYHHARLLHPRPS